MSSHANDGAHKVTIHKPRHSPCIGNQQTLRLRATVPHFASIRFRPAFVIAESPSSSFALVAA
jgi:hypothetical protein